MAFKQIVSSFTTTKKKKTPLKFVCIRSCAHYNLETKVQQCYFSVEQGKLSGRGRLSAECACIATSGLVPCRPETLGSFIVCGWGLRVFSSDTATDASPDLPPGKMMGVWTAGLSSCQLLQSDLAAESSLARGVLHPVTARQGIKASTGAPGLVNLRHNVNVYVTLLVSLGW